jgi:acyl carrier protein
MSDISVRTIIECVRKVANKDVAEDTDIFSAGVDSLAVLRCRALLKEQTGIRIPGHVFFGGRTPAGIVELIGAENAGR